MTNAILTLAFAATAFVLGLSFGYERGATDTRAQLQTQNEALVGEINTALPKVDEIDARVRALEKATISLHGDLGCTENPHRAAQNDQH